MQKTLFTAACLFMVFISLTNCTGSSSNSAVGDTIKSGDGVLPKPSSNSDATNPSIPDTAIIKYDSTAHKAPDSLKH